MLQDACFLTLTYLCLKSSPKTALARTFAPEHRNFQRASEKGENRNVEISTFSALNKITRNFSSESAFKKRLDFPKKFYLMYALDNKR